MEYQIPGDAFICETGASEYQIPGGAFICETQIGGEPPAAPADVIMRTLVVDFVF